MAALNLGVGFKSPLRHTRNLWSDLRIGPFCRPRTGRETSRTSANQWSSRMAGHRQFPGVCAGQRNRSAYLAGSGHLHL